MAWNDVYVRQIGLLLRIIPLVAEEGCFALKGGTAINLFLRDMPRLSVDIDLTYLLVQPRPKSLSAIDSALRRIESRIKAVLPAAQISASTLPAEKIITRLLVRHENVQIKIEVTPVLRGCVFEPSKRTVTQKVENSFGFAEIQVVSFADLYAGKVVAALDRQHPRDFFDIRDLLANEGVTPELRKAFLIYLISHNRPIAEILSPQRKSLALEFNRGFEGMTEQPVELQSLEAAREALIRAVVVEMPDADREFLRSFKRGEPQWDLLGVPGVDALPAVQWKIQNLNQLRPEERARLIGNLDAVLFP